MFLLWFRNNRTQKLFAMDIFSLGDQNLLIKAVYLFGFTTSRAILLISTLITYETMKPSRFNFTYATGYMHLEILCSFHFHLYFQCFFSLLFLCPNQAWNFDAKIFHYFLVSDISRYLCWCRADCWAANTVPLLCWTFCSWWVLQISFVQTSQVCDGCLRSYIWGIYPLWVIEKCTTKLA